MDTFPQRGRSPSGGRTPHSHSPSPHPSPYQNPTNLGFDPSINNSAAFAAGKFPTSGADGMNSNMYAYNTAFQPIPNQSQQQFMPQGGYSNGGQFFDQSQIANQLQHQEQMQSGFNAGTTFDSFIDPTGGQADEFSNSRESIPNQTYTPDYSQQSPYQNQNTDISRKSSPHVPTPPSNLLSPEDHTSPGQSPSPSSTAGAYYSPQHSRHASLDPSSAAYPQSHEWSSLNANSSFQLHRRMASDQSDISSQPSPYLGHSDQFEPYESNPSPMLNPLTDVNDYTSDFGIQNINLAEQTRRSPFHSAHASPQLVPHQPQGLTLSQDFTLVPAPMSQPHESGPEIFTSHVDNALQKLHDVNGGSSDMGQANQFPVPIIDIEPAPVSRQASFEPDKGNNVYDTLSPPARARGRSKSDPYVRQTSRQGSRSVSPGAGHVRSPSLAGASSMDSHSARSLSPMAPMTSSSRDPSPNRIEKNRRSSTSSVPSRDYILDLADPDRPNASPNAGNARVQKHPATFQCTLCPKRFTRAYNLRSHLRTHTDERPFVCTVCGKAFARQHDRKRHEGLHSGEKKFVCKGDLTQGGQWGCGRRFARADALGRHFRSEAGRVCIKPLLDEEAQERERQRLAMDHQQSLDMQHAGGMPGGLQPTHQPMMVPSQGHGAHFMLPAALLAQYPALNNIDWSTVQPGDDPGDMSDIGANGSQFDASSGGEIWDDEDLGSTGGGAYVEGTQPANPGMVYAPQQGGW